MGSIPIDEFKVKCLHILNEVHEVGRPLTISKNGKPFAIVVPYPADAKPKSALFGILKDNIMIHGDIISPINDKWTAKFS